MNLFRQFGAYGKLTPVQRGILKGKAFTSSHSAAEWLDLVDDIADYDKIADKARTEMVWILVFGFMIIGAFGMTEPELPMIGLAFVPWVLIFIYYIRVRRRDLHNNFRQCVLPVVRVMNEDMAPTTELSLTVDCTGHVHKDKLYDTIDTPGRGRIRYIKDQHYRDPWFCGHAKLADGSRLNWSMTELTRKRTKGTRSASGKYKTKIKYKIKSVVVVKVAFRDEQLRYNAPEKSRLGVEKRNGGVVVTSKKMNVHTDEKHVHDADALLDVIGEIFRGIKVPA